MAAILRACLFFLVFLNRILSSCFSLYEGYCKAAAIRRLQTNLQHSTWDIWLSFQLFHLYYQTIFFSSSYSAKRVKIQSWLKHEQQIVRGRDLSYHTLFCWSLFSNYFFFSILFVKIIHEGELHLNTMFFVHFSSILHYLFWGQLSVGVYVFYFTNLILPRLSSNFIKIHLHV